MRTLPSSLSEPINATPINMVPSYEMVPFGEEYVIPELDEENRFAASIEPVHEEAEVEQNTSTPQASSLPPQLSVEEEGVEEIEEYVDIGCTPGDK